MHIATYEDVLLLKSVYVRFVHSSVNVTASHTSEAISNQSLLTFGERHE